MLYISLILSHMVECRASEPLSCYSTDWKLQNLAHPQGGVNWRRYWQQVLCSKVVYAKIIFELRSQQTLSGYNFSNDKHLKSDLIFVIFITIKFYHYKNLPLPISQHTCNFCGDLSIDVQTFTQIFYVFCISHSVWKVGVGL